MVFDLSRSLFFRKPLENAAINEISITLIFTRFVNVIRDSYDTIIQLKHLTMRTEFSALGLWHVFKIRKNFCVSGQYQISCVTRYHPISRFHNFTHIVSSTNFSTSKLFFLFLRQRETDRDTMDSTKTKKNGGKTSKSSEESVKSKGVKVIDVLYSIVGTLFRIACLYYVVVNAYEIRLFAINTYGRVIHEFDPWFNFRATKYLAENGWTKFFRWFDYKVWYPLGSVERRYINADILRVPLEGVELDWCCCNEFECVCVFVPAWLGATSSIWLGMLTAEASGSNHAGVIAAAIYAIIPAHIMRSVGGGYDNESVAMDCMCATFYFWVRSIRGKGSWKFGVLTGLAYTCMVATWGGYIFIVNMIGVHASLLVATGRTARTYVAPTRCFS